MLFIAEVLRHGQTREAHAHTGSRRFVHLPIDQRGLGQNAGFLHLVVEIVALTGTLADACKDRQAAVFCGNVVDQLHDENGLADAGAAKQADLAALGIRTNQINDLDAGLKDLRGRFLLVVGRGRAMDGPAFLHRRGRLVIHRVSQQIKDAAQAGLSNGDRDGSAGIQRLDAALESVC